MRKTSSRLFAALALCAALALSALGGALLAGWRGGPAASSPGATSSDSGPVSSPAPADTLCSVQFILTGSVALPVEIHGLNCDAMTVDAQGAIYLANPRFMATFADCSAEGSAYLQEGGQIAVHLTKAVETSRPSGTVNGPQITFVVNYETGELLSSEVTELEGHTILMPESEQEKWGKVLASLLLTARTMEESLQDSPSAFALSQ